MLLKYLPMEITDAQVIEYLQKKIEKCKRSLDVYKLALLALCPDEENLVPRQEDYEREEVKEKSWIQEQEEKGRVVRVDLQEKGSVEEAKKKWDDAGKKPVQPGDDDRRKKYRKIVELMNGGKSTTEACDEVGVTSVTYYNWVRKFGTEEEKAALEARSQKFGVKKKLPKAVDGLKKDEIGATEREELAAGEEDEDTMRARLAKAALDA